MELIEFQVQWLYASNTNQDFILLSFYIFYFLRVCKYKSKYYYNNNSITEFFSLLLFPLMNEFITLKSELHQHHVLRVNALNKGNCVAV